MRWANSERELELEPVTEPEPVPAGRRVNRAQGRSPPPLGPAQSRIRPSHPCKPEIRPLARLSSIKPLLRAGFTLHLAHAPPAPCTQTEQTTRLTNASCRCSRTTRKTRPAPCARTVKTLISTAIPQPDWRPLPARCFIRDRTRPSRPSQRPATGL